MADDLENTTEENRTNQTIVFSYGGGRQSVAIVLLCAEGRIPWPDRIIMADTGLENATTWSYHEKNIQPVLERHHKRLEIAGPQYSRSGLYSNNGALIIPVYSLPRGKYSTWCSSEWKRRVRDRYMRDHNIHPTELWLGLGYEEERRWRRTHMTRQGNTLVRCPLVELQITTAEALQLIQRHGLPAPTHSSCYICPQKTNKEWIELKTQSPEQWAAAVKLDNEIREDSIDDGKGPVYLHYSRKPLEQAIRETEDNETPRRCESEGCFT